MDFTAYRRGASGPHVAERNRAPHVSPQFATRACGLRKTLAAAAHLIPGTVLKRFDSNKLYVLACQDVVERFHLLITLSFVVVEEMGSSGHSRPNRAIVVQVGGWGSSLLG